MTWTHLAPANLLNLYGWLPDNVASTIIVLILCVIAGGILHFGGKLLNKYYSK